jgi:hypothetical protein
MQFLECQEETEKSGHKNSRVEYAANLPDWHNPD